MQEETAINKCTPKRLGWGFRLGEDGEVGHWMDRS